MIKDFIDLLIQRIEENVHAQISNDITIYYGHIPKQYPSLGIIYIEGDLFFSEGAKGSHPVMTFGFTYAKTISESNSEIDNIDNAYNIMQLLHTPYTISLISDNKKTLYRILKIIINDNHVEIIDNNNIAVVWTATIELANIDANEKIPRLQLGGS